VVDPTITLSSPVTDFRLRNKALWLLANANRVGQGASGGQLKLSKEGETPLYAVIESPWPFNFVQPVVSEE
jgi:hypothetical protein